MNWSLGWEIRADEVAENLDQAVPGCINILTEPAYLNRDHEEWYEDQDQDIYWAKRGDIPLSLDGILKDPIISIQILSECCMHKDERKSQRRCPTNTRISVDPKYHTDYHLMLGD
ncbi:hypothetical protein EYR41_011680 [Orbilia oligospora]|uniref:Uncharacterized protein n=1 Tax=Orbilia oligospora TaxID=2813651 RepID=A0A8H2DSA4_ORBOL|nr:hypothetical protein EYR41_011680 [Orbilia oligospora]